MPHLSDTVQYTESNGQRLAFLRARRRWTQAKLARETGYSLSSVKAFEQGRRSLDRGTIILAFARALDCHPTEITGRPITPTDTASQDATVSVAAVRRALLRHGRPARATDEETARLNLRELRQRVDEANALRQRAALTRTASLLPALLRDVQVAVDTWAGTDQLSAYDLLASTYECAMQYLYKLGHASDATLATERVIWATQATDNPLRVLSARWYEAGEYLAIGEHDDAGDIIDHALTELGNQPLTPQVLSLQGAFYLKAALNAARSGNPKAAVAHLNRAQKTADRLGQDRNDYQLQFGPTNAAIWSVSLPVEMGRGRDAVRAAHHVTTQLPHTFSAERRSHHWIDLGRGHWYNGQRDKALDAFLTAESIAPTATRMHSGVQETVRTMIRTQRRGTLLEFGLRVGAL